MKRKLEKSQLNTVQKSNKPRVLRNLVIGNFRKSPATTEEGLLVHKEFQTAIPLRFEGVKNVSSRNLSKGMIESLSRERCAFFVTYLFKSKIGLDRGIETLRHSHRIRDAFLLGKHSVSSVKNSKHRTVEFYFPENRPSDGKLHFHSVLFVSASHPRLFDIEKVVQHSFFSAIVAKRGPKREHKGSQRAAVNAMMVDEALSGARGEETYLEIRQVDSVNEALAYCTKELESTSSFASSLDWLPTAQCRSLELFDHALVDELIARRCPQWKLAPRRSLEDATGRLPPPPGGLG